MIRSLRNRRVLLCLLASLAVHMLFLWAYQRWAAEPVLRALRPARFELAPSLEPERFEPAPRATVPEVVMEQLRLAELMMEAQLPEVAMAPPSLVLESLAPEPDLEAEAKLGLALLPADTLSYEDALTDLYRRKLVELHGRRIRVLPLADTTSEAGRRRNRAREIIDRAIEAMGGLERLRAVRDKRVEVKRWDDGRQSWESAGVRSYLSGDRFRLDIGPRLARGYDGRRSWYLHYGLLLPPRDERYNAERWDFLTRFRGEGLVVEYVGPRKGNYRTLEAVRVIDTVFGRERLAYFDVADSLLYAEVEGGRATTYRRYRETQGVLTPFEIGGGYRWHTELNTGLTADPFYVPEEVSWDPESVRIVVFEHAPVPPGGPVALRLQVADLAQGRRPPHDPLVKLLRGRHPEGVPWLGALDMRLMDTYMKRKLRAAGILAGTDPPDWRLFWQVEGFRIVSEGEEGEEGPPLIEPVKVATLEVAVRVQSLRDEGWWEGSVQHRWVVPKPETEEGDWSLKGAFIDDRVADDVTWEVIRSASAGIEQLLDARTAAAQPAATPSAGSSSGSE